MYQRMVMWERRIMARINACAMTYSWLNRIIMRTNAKVIRMMINAKVTKCARAARPCDMAYYAHVTDIEYYRHVGTCDMV